MGRSKVLEQAVQFIFRIQGQKPVDLPDIFVRRIIALIHVCLLYTSVDNQNVIFFQVIFCAIGTYLSFPM